MIEKLIEFLKDKNIIILGFGMEGETTYDFIRNHLPTQKLTIADMNEVIIEDYPYLQEDNYERVKSILKYGNININSFVCDVTKVKFDGSYDLVNLSNILPYNFSGDRIGNAIEFFKESFNLTDNGEIINYVFNMSGDVEDKFRELLEPNGYIEELGDNKKLLVYRNRPIK